MALEIKEAKERHPGRWIFIVTLLGLLTALGWYGYRWYTTGDLPPLPFLAVSAGISVDESDISQEQIDAYSVPTTHPRYLNIPSLGVQKARVYPVGLDENNLLISPRNIHDVIWYDKSAQPGNGGVTIIEGLSNGATRTGVFAKLSSLMKGDIVSVERGDGQIFNYLVDEVISMDLDQFVALGMQTMTQTFNDNKEALNITTTGGKWVPRLGTFDTRILLRATLKD